MMSVKVKWGLLLSVTMVAFVVAMTAPTEAGRYRHSSGSSGGSSGSSGSYGSSGSSGSSGSRGIGFRRAYRHASSGSSGSYGSSGGYIDSYGSSGGYSSFYGSSGSSGGYMSSYGYGSSGGSSGGSGYSPYPTDGHPVDGPAYAPEDPAYVPGQEQAPEPKVNQESSALENKARLTIAVPQDAVVSLNGMKMNSVGGKRQYVSPELATASPYYYHIQVEIVRNGEKQMVDHQQIIQAGRSYTITFAEQDNSLVLINPTPAEEVASR